MVVDHAFCTSPSCAVNSRSDGRDFYDFVWYVGGGIRCNVAHLRARMVQTGHWPEDRDLDIGGVRQLLTRRFQQIDFDQARDDVRPFVRNDAEPKLSDRSFFQSLAGQVDG